MLFKHIAEPKTSESSRDDQIGVIEYQRSTHSYRQCTSILLELPRIQSAGRRLPIADAILSGEVLRSFGRRMSFEVFRSSYNNGSDVRPNADRDHVFIELLT